MATRKKKTPTRGNPSDLLTVPQAAEILGVTYQAVAQAIKLGRIESEKVGHVSLVTRAAVMKYKKTRRPAPPRNK